MPVRSHPMKLSTIQKDDIAVVPQVSRENVRLLWSNDWYDGPLTGIAEVNGVKFLFDIVDRNVLGAEEEQRTYWLIQLNEDQLHDEERWHELFCQKVGTHFDHTGREPLPRDAVNMEAFYGPYSKRPEPVFGNNDVFGWFRL